MQEFQNVSLVLALLSLPDIIHDHVSDFLHAVPLLRKVLSEGTGVVLPPGVTGSGASLEGDQVCAAMERAVTQ
jgi:hypothetical protein